MILTRASDGCYEIVAAVWKLTIAFQAVNYMVETADWEFSSLMGVQVVEVLPTLGKLDQLIHPHTGGLNSGGHIEDEVDSRSSAAKEFQPQAALAGDVQVKLIASTLDIHVIHDSLNTVIGAYGKIRILADRSGSTVEQVRTFSDEFYGLLLSTKR